MTSIKRYTDSHCRVRCASKVGFITIVVADLVCRPGEDLGIDGADRARRDVGYVT